MFRKLATKHDLRRRAQKKRRSAQHRLRFESLEDRRLLAVFHLNGGVEDDAPGSLRAAITQANANGEDDTIHLAAGAYTLSVSDLARDDDNSHGDLDLTEAGTTITIRGAGQQNTTINTHELFNERVLQVLPNVRVVIEDVTITGGFSGFVSGGGIHNQGHLTLRRTGVTDNSTSRSIFGEIVQGGGIYNTGTLEIEDSNISNNETLLNCFNWCLADENEGAGIYNAGTLLVTGSTITNNRTWRSSGSTNLSAGGGLSNSGTATLTNTLVRHNSASKGGGVYNTGTLTLDAATLASNIPDNLRNNGGTVIIKGAPEAADDSYSVNEDETLTIAASGVLANDSDPNDDPLTTVLVSTANHGTLTLNDDGSFEYTPRADYHGNDSFIYRASDGVHQSKDATVAIEVKPVNDAPIAVNDTFYVAPGEVLRVPAARSILRNDSDTEGSELSAVLVESTTSGELTLSDDGTFTYAPADGFQGVDSFQYRVSDGELESNEATVTIRVETIAVTTIDDEDDGSLGGGTGVSLREAIRYAPAGAVIDVPAGEYLLVRKGDRENAGVTGDLDLVRDVTIRGAGADVTIIDAHPLARDSDPVSGDRAIHVLPGVLADLRGLTLTGGRPDVSGGFNPGGAVLNQGTLSISDSVLRDNKAVGFAKILTQNGEILNQLSGGAIHNTGALTISDSTIADNEVLERVRTCFSAFVPCQISHRTGGEGGGIWSSGQLTLVNTQLRNNAAHNGGGISNKAQLSATDVVLADNLANDFGGAIHSISTATDNLVRVTIAGNSALYGGGINTHGEITISDSTMRDNSAIPGEGLSDAGGLLIQGTGSGVVTGSTFHDNSADLGGGIHVYSGGKLHVINSTVSGNAASTFGGGIINRFSGDLTLTNVTVTNNTADSGGGLHAEFNPIVINNSIVAANRNLEGAGDDIDGAVIAQYSLVEHADKTFFLDDQERPIDPVWANNITEQRPRIGPLQDNGGLTWTHALMSQSPAIDAGANALAVDQHGDPLTIDQRGGERIVDGGNGQLVDMGAYEVPQALPPGNEPPVVSDDSYAMDADATLVVNAANGVLANDHDPEGDPITAVLQRQPNNGQVILAGDGSFTYQPQAGFAGNDSFTYVADDGTDASHEATVTITVNALNRPPVATHDGYEVDEGSTLTVAAPGLLSNDVDADGDALVAFPMHPPSHGIVQFEIDGSFLYTPDAGFSGVDRFTYVAFDGQDESNTATVTITVHSVNAPPVANNDDFSLNQDQTLTVDAPGVLLNDTDDDGDGLTAALITGPANGTVTLETDGSFTYVPDPGFAGIDSFTYVASDGLAASAEATVTLTVNAVNQRPEAADDQFQVDQDHSLTIAAAGVLANDRDGDGDTLSAVVIDGPAHGALTLNADGSFEYTPEPGYFGVDDFTYVANDGTENSNVAQVSIEVTQIIPPVLPKFLVADADTAELFAYDDIGMLVSRQTLDSQSDAPRGTAANIDGSLRWVIDDNHEVSVYDADGKPLGNWRAEGLRRPEGIATDGEHLWIVDRGTDRVYRFSGAAQHRDGSHAPQTSFPLVRGNRNPRGITTDGTRIWVVNSGRNRDVVFQYTTSGMPLGNWTIDSRNTSPAGIALDVSGNEAVWIVDGSMNVIFRYDQAATRTSGSQAADALFALAAENTNPQGLADPDVDGDVGSMEPGLTYSEWHNPLNWLDVSNDQIVSPFDMLLVINRMRQTAEGESGSAPVSYFDVNNDGLATPLDALLILNRLREGEPTDDPDDEPDGGAEGEAFARAADAVYLDADWLQDSLRR